MKRTWLIGMALLVTGVAFAQGYAPSVRAVSSGVSSQEVLDLVEDAGVRKLAHHDSHAAAFVASGMTADGGTSAYAFISNRDAKWKLGSGSLNELRPAGNALYLDNSATHITTGYIAQPACTAGQHCRWFGDGWQPGWIPRGSVPACAAGQEGGMVAVSSDQAPWYCNGSEAVKLGAEVGGAFQLPAYTTVSLPAVNPKGRLVYDSDADCVKFTNGTTWSCL